MKLIEKYCSARTEIESEIRKKIVGYLFYFPENLPIENEATHAFDLDKAKIDVIKEKIKNDLNYGEGNYNQELMRWEILPNPDGHHTFEEISISSLRTFKKKINNQKNAGEIDAICNRFSINKKDFINSLNEIIETKMNLIDSLRRK